MLCLQHELRKGNFGAKRRDKPQSNSVDTRTTFSVLRSHHATDKLFQVLETEQSSFGTPSALKNGHLPKKTTPAIRIGLLVCDSHQVPNKTQSSFPLDGTRESRSLN